VTATTEALFADDFPAEQATAALLLIALWPPRSPMLMLLATAFPDGQREELANT
jgi:hypothetical protein